MHPFAHDLFAFVRRSLPVLVAASLCAAASGVDADPGDWPHWRGPDGDNISKETGWSSVGSAAPLWRADVGRGYSSPAIAAGRLYINGYFEGDDTPDEGVDRVQCFDAESGELLWKVEYAASAFANEHAGGALSTPTVTDGVVLVPTRKGEVRALDAVTGETLWEVDLVERHGVEPGRYGFASSAFVLEDAFVLNAGRTLMLAAATGETLWISDDFKANYSTVVPMTLGERACLVVFGEVGLVVLDAASGEHVHTYVFRKAPRNVEGATPIVIGTQVFISSAYDHGGVMVDFSGEAPALLWSARRMRSKMDGCTLYEGHLYGFDESMLKCLDLAGNELWRVRGLGHGALSISDGRILTTTSKGELIVAVASPDGFEELSRRDVVSDGVFWTAPVLSAGRIIFRGSKGDLVCLDHRAGAAAEGVASASAAGAETPTGQDLPSASALEAAHLAASGLKAKPLSNLSFSGRLHNDALGLADRPAKWMIGAGGRWHCEFDLPPGFGGSIKLFFDGSRGWQLDPFRGNALLEGKQLDELRGTQGFQLLFDPLPAGVEARTAALEEFHGRACHRVDVVLGEDETRHVFFDAETGLLAGRTAEGEDTVLFGGWRVVDDWKLPLHRTVFDADTGEEQRWRFTEVGFEPLDDALFELPEGLEQDEEGEGESGDSDG